ncbi:tetratricopeptide repeat protein [Carboxydochorda subterranea]|uniref:Tetratricopeptide repeat protein n=1 Tax=Carboxydichorda subterranea TaxID=3109565 RepID=A0ABZ1BUG2_9FIRM|nr:tetratricopeptide repeat protein [Limnochorda sp. L945t]WRP16451.1 tetratricopeptide repeat protein [Limnochorda sp. L945t]
MTLPSTGQPPRLLSDSPRQAIRDLVVYARSGPPAKELRQAFAEFFGPDVETRELPGGSTGALFIEWFLFDRPMGSGDTPAQQYALASPTLSGDERRAYLELCDTVPGFFEVVGFGAGGMWLTVFPAPGRRHAGEASREAIWVEEPAASRRLSRGDVIWTRLLRWRGRWHLATCCFVLPPSARDLLGPLEALRPRYSERAWRHLMARLEPELFRDLILNTDEGILVAPPDALPLTETERRFYLAQGDRLVRSGQLRAALHYFWRILADRPLDLDARLGVARVRLLQGRNSSAEKALRSVLRQYPDHAEALSTLGRLLEARGSVDEAEALLRRLKRIGEADPEALFSLGRIALQRGRLRQAVDQFQRAVDRVSPRSRRGAARRESALLLDAGWQLLRAGRVQEARGFFHHVCAVSHSKGEQASAWHGLGQALSRQGHWLEGAAALLQALRLGIDRPKLWAEVGRLYGRAGRLKEAELAYQASVERLPGYVEGIVGLASVLLRQGRVAEAMRLAHRAGAIAPDDSRVWRVIGGCWLRLGHAGKAIEALDRALALNPRDINARGLKRRALSALGQKAPAGQGGSGG